MRSYDDFNQAFEKYGYEVMGEFGIKGRRFYQKGGERRSHHIHAFEKGSQEIKRHILFREYMCTFPEKAQEYSQLKKILADAYRTEPEKYNKGKTEFIHRIDHEAKQWAEIRRKSYDSRKEKI